MKGIISVNSDYQDWLQGKSENHNRGSLRIIQELEERKHDVAILYPEDIDEKGLPYLRLYKQQGNKLNPVNPLDYVPADFFLMREYGQNHAQSSLPNDFINALPNVENHVSTVINSSAATAYNTKAKQRNLDLPFIPSFQVNNQSDLESILSQNLGIIAKPSAGLRSQGLHYLSMTDDIKKYGFTDQKIKSYVFEEFIPASNEIRIAMLDGKIILVREKILSGPPGNEKMIFYRQTTPTEQQKKIAISAFEQTGMSFGSVDFRNQYVLELNGSGLGIIPGKDWRAEYTKDKYDLAPQLVDRIEKKAI